jgi:hypothetical protein
MPWNMVRGRKYFYANEWVGGRSVRRYFGAGPLAELAAAQSDLRRVEREAGRRARWAEAEPWERAEAALSDLGGLTDLVVRAAMAAAGYDRHRRGHWRKWRGRKGEVAGG